MKEVYEKLNQYKDLMKFNPPIGESELSEKCAAVPAPLMKLYHYFNGGEIFVPGTKIFGLTGRKDDIILLNQSKTRQMFGIPETYLIFARLNFGDYICINRKEPYDLIQWDHENDEEFYSWDSIEEWLNETIEDFEKYESGE